jgi:hypothetical protein
MDTVHLTPSSVSAALDLVNSTVTTVKTLVGLTKDINNNEIKNEISAVLSSALDLKIMVHDLAEENKNLREQLAQRASVKRSGPLGYYFQEGDADPLCPKCYEGSEKIAHLSAAKEDFAGTSRKCLQCSEIYWERKISPYQERGSNSGSGGGSSWMR